MTYRCNPIRDLGANMLTEESSVIAFDDLLPDYHSHGGVKCASLATMGIAGLPVPPGFAVTTAAFNSAKNASGTMSEIIRTIGHSEGAEAAAQCRKIVDTWELLPEHEERIRRAYAQLCEMCGLGDVPVAVRSSATAEDSPDASFAGEHDAYLWACGSERSLAR